MRTKLEAAVWKGRMLAGDISSPLKAEGALMKKYVKSQSKKAVGWGPILF